MCITKILTLYGDLFSKDIVVKKLWKSKFCEGKFEAPDAFHLNLKISAHKLQIKRSIQSTK